MIVIFDVLHLYYLPQYLPVLTALKQQGVDVRFVFYRQLDPELNQVCEKVIQDENLQAIWVENWTSALDYYLEAKADWIVFGNAVKDQDIIHTVSKTALMQHGIGPKACYYDVSENPTTVRFVEGQHRLKRLNTLYPNDNFIDTGYAKLDPAMHDVTSTLSVADLGLDPTKPTILYAPTFYPSSIEMFSKQFAQAFSNFNIIVKPHFFSLTKSKYQQQRKMLETWAQADNVYLAQTDDYNLMPFMAISDVMLSDASSAIFEFAALNKPVVWCDFYKLRWTYRGVFSFRFKKRLDDDIQYFNQVAYRAESYHDLLSVVPEALKNGVKHGTSDVVEQLAGKIDGLCSKRIADYLVEYSG